MDGLGKHKDHKHKDKDHKKKPKHFPDPIQTTGLLRLNHPIGSFLTTPGGILLFVVRANEDGHTSQVYKCLNKDKQTFALKITYQDDEKMHKSIQAEHRKYVDAAEVGATCPAVTEIGINYCLRPWIEGVRGDVWYHQWHTAGYPPNDPGFQALVKLWITITKQGVYIQNLKALNVIWSFGEWVIVDSGYVKSGSPDVCMFRFCTHFDRRWQKKHQKHCEEHKSFIPVHQILISFNLYKWKDLGDTADSLKGMIEDRMERRKDRKDAEANAVEEI